MNDLVHEDLSKREVVERALGFRRSSGRNISEPRLSREESVVARFNASSKLSDSISSRCDGRPVAASMTRMSSTSR